MAAELELYPYQTLADGDIRVLSLEPGQFEDHIRVSIRHAPLPPRQRGQAAAEEYQAISYSWGSSDLPHSVTVNERYRLSITQSLSEVLRHFRYRDRWRHLWIDAVCIDQNDLAEKSIQVAVMGEIYQKAADVLIWLGPGGEQTYLAFAMLNAITVPGKQTDTLSEVDVGMMLKKEQDTARSHRHTGNFLTRAQYDFCCSCCLNKDYLMNASEACEAASVAIDQLSRRDWFYRLWIAQEIALAKQNRLWIHCGHHVADFAALGRLDGWINHGGNVVKHRSLFMAHCHASLLAAMSNVAKIRRNWLRKDTDFLEMLIRSWHMICKEPLDRIYAVRAITDVAHWTEVAVNYSMEPWALYRQVMLECLNNGEQLERPCLPPAVLLSIAPLTRTSDDGWPSWLPDFHSFSERCSRRIEMYRGSPTGLGMAPNCFQQGPVEMGVSTSATHLRLAGVGFGRIKGVARDVEIGCSSGCTVLRDGNRRYRIGMDVDCSKLNAWVTRCYTFLRRYEWRRSLSAQLATLKKRSPCEITEHQNSSCAIEQLISGEKRLRDTWCHRYEHACLAVLLALLWNTDQSIAHLLSLLQSESGPLSDIEPERVIAAIDVDGTIFFGWVPETTKIGDRMCIVSGATYPFVVRQATGDHTHTLLGDALVPGIRELDISGWSSGHENFVTFC